MELTREQALALLQKYNKEPFHIQHALTVEGVMRWFAQEQGEDVEFWSLCGLLHDIDFEVYPDRHCQVAPELLAEVNASQEMVHAICSHGYGLCSDVEPVHVMEKILPQEEIQGQEICRRLFPGRHQAGRRTSRLDPGRDSGQDHPGHAQLRGLRFRRTGSPLRLIQKRGCKITVHEKRRIPEKGSSVDILYLFVVQKSFRVKKV